MHLLSQQNYSEFLSCPQLIRFENARASDSFEPTLLIKSSTLLLKYIILGASMQLAFTLYNGRLICALRVRDNGNSGCVIWSIVERKEELDGIRGLTACKSLIIHLFNEIAINVAWTKFDNVVVPDYLLEMIDNTILGPIDYSHMNRNIEHLFEHLYYQAKQNDAWLILEDIGRSNWNPLDNVFITSAASSSLINIFNKDEGKQQEQLGIWLTDNLQPAGSYYSPQIPKGAGTRELTDILLSHQFGSILIESKALSILTREKLPDRTKLKQDVSYHIKKAFKQLRGAIRALKSNLPVTNLKGETLIVERENPVHAIVLVPELNLIDDRAVYNLELLENFIRKTGGFIHILDVSELLRIVQAAEIIAERNKAATLMMAFDYYLMERMQKVAESGTLCIEVLLRLPDKDGEDY